MTGAQDPSPTTPRPNVRGPRALVRYAGAVVAVAVAAGARWLLDDALGRSAQFVTFFTAVAVVAMFAGRGPGLLATALSAAVAGAWQYPSNDLGVVAVGLFVAAGAVVSEAGGRLNRALHVSTETAARLRAEVERRARAEEALRAREERLRLALADGRLGVWEWDVGTDGLFWSSEMFALTGLEPTQFGGTRDDFVRLIHPEDRGAFDALVTSVLNAGDGFEVEHRIARPDGAVRWLMSRGEVLRHAGRTERVLGIVADITDRKRTEEALRESEANYRRVFENMSEMFQIIEPVFDGAGRAIDLRYIEVNPATEAFTGLTRKEIVGQTAKQLWMIVEDYWVEMLGGVVRTGRSAQMANYSRQMDAHYEVKAWKLDDRRVALLVSNVTERKRAESVLAESERRLNEAQQVGQIGSWEWNAATDQNIVTDELCRIFGLPVGQPIPDFKEQVGRMYPHEAWVQLNAATEEALRGGNGYDLELEALRGSVPIWVHVLCEVVRDRDGRVRGLRGTVQDITRRKHLDEALRASEARYRGLFDQLLTGIAETDSDGRFVRVNDRYCAITGYGRDELLGGLRMQDITAAEDLPENLKRWHRLLVDGTPFEVEKRYVRKDGTRVWVHNSVSVVRDGQGRIASLVAVVADITDRKRAEDLLRDREERLRRVSDNADVGLTRLSRDWVYLSANPAYAKITGKPVDQIVGRPMVEVLGASGVETIRPYVERVLRGERVTYETVVPFVGTGPRYLHVSYSPDIELSGEIVGWVASVTDISERKRAEEVLRNREQQLVAEAAALARLNATGSRLWSTEDEREGFDEILSAAIDLLGADMGYVQLLDAARGVLRVAAQRGLDGNSLTFLRESATEDDSAYCRALRGGGRTIIEDVETDESYAPLRPVARTAGYRAVQSTPLIGRDGHPTGMISTLFRVPHRPDERELRWLDLLVRLANEFFERCRIVGALRASEERQAFVLRLADELRPLADPVAIQGAAARALGEYLRASRLGYAESEDGGETFEARYQYTARLPELTGRLRTADFGAGLAEHLRAGRRVQWADVTYNPALSAAERESFAAAGIAAEVVIPLVKAGRLVAVLFAHFDRPHDWAPAEIALLEDVAERTWAAVERARAEAALRGSHDTFLGLVRNAPFGVYIVNSQFLMVEVSAGAQKAFAGVRPLLGRDFAEILRVIWPEPFATEALDRFRHTLITGEPYHSVDTTEQRHDVPVVESYDWRIERVTMPDGTFGVVCYFYETTALRYAAARDAFRAALADALRPMTDPAEMKVAACRLLVRHLAAGRASYAEVEPDDAHVVIAAEHTDGMPSFAGRYRADDFGPAIIDALRAGRTLAIDDVTARLDLTESERATYAAVGIRSLVVVPLIKGGRWLGALGVNAAAPRAWAADEVALIEEVAERMWAAVERARAEEALRASAERLRLAIRASHIGLWDWNLITDTVVYSPEWKAQLGYTEDEIGTGPGKWESLLHPDDRGPALARIRKTIAGPESSHETEFRMRHKDGSWRWIFTRAEVFRDAAGGGVRMLGCHLDVTERKRTEENVREREAKLVAILDTAADAIITIDRTGAIESANATAERMFGYAPGELLGRNVSVLMPPPHRDRHDGYIARYITTGEARIIGVGREMTALRKDGTVFPVELAVSEIDHLRQFTGIVRDITRRKELEREVVEAATTEQRRIGEDLHDTVGQELTALTIQTGDLVYALDTDPSAAQRLAENMARGLRRCQQQLRAVIRGLLPVAVDAGGLMAALSDLVDRTRDESALECAFDCPEPVAVADNLTATQLYLIAQEAVHNALKHARAQRVRVALAPLARGGLVLRVADDGRGMPTDPPAGNGQGLRIMGHRAALIGARLTIGPATPTGTVVTCELIGGDHG